MPTFHITFERMATVPCRGTIAVPAADSDEADAIAEQLLMQGRIDLHPANDELEYDRDNAAVIISRKEY